MGCDFCTQVYIVVEFLPVENAAPSQTTCTRRYADDATGVEKHYVYWDSDERDGDFADLPKSRAEGLEERMAQIIAEYGRRVVLEDGVWTCTQRGRARITESILEVHHSSDRVVRVYKIKDGWIR